MRTITAAARELRVGKTRLYSLLTETGVEPFQQGKSRMIDDAQLQILQNAIHPTLDLKDDPDRPTEQQDDLKNGKNVPQDPQNLPQNVQNPTRNWSNACPVRSTT